MYRLLRAAGPVRERRAQGPTRPGCVQLVADGPDQVWSWDITKLKGPFRGLYYDAYVMLDIYSRKNIHWEVHSTENGELAQDFITNCIIANRGVVPGTIHSDNGTSMTSKNVAALLADLHIERSLSRPHVSNDNPYSEAAFKTLKYCPAFPGSFTSIYDARVFLGLFFEYYNTEHRHSGIGLYTPDSVHDGTWKYVRDGRQVVLDAAYLAHPERFHRVRCPIVPGQPGHYGGTTGMGEIGVEKTQELLRRIQGRGGENGRRGIATHRASRGRSGYQRRYVGELGECVSA